MKRFTATATAVLLAATISHSVSAHSHLGASNPADGEIITEPLNEIVLEFDGQVEQGSFIDVTASSGQAIELEDITIEEDTLTASVAEPLPNDDYQVNWSIVSADGHPLEGEFAFTVNAPVTEPSEEVTEEPAQSTETAEETTNADNQSTEAQEETTAEDVEEESSATPIIIVVLLAVIVVAGLLFFNKKRK